MQITLSNHESDDSIKRSSPHFSTSISMCACMAYDHKLVNKKRKENRASRYVVESGEGSLLVSLSAGDRTPGR